MPTPIAVFAYRRPHHVRRTLEALSANTLAARSHITIFCDGAKGEADAIDVAKTRAVAHDAAGFASIDIREAPENRGLAASITSGVTELLAKHERVIVFEDDIVSHPQTLEYMNAALDRYAATPSVFSISAYQFPSSVMSIPDDYRHDVYFTPKMQCWGWATWADRWARCDLALGEFADLDNDPSFVRAYSEWMGEAHLERLRDAAYRGRDIWACKWSLAHFQHHAFCACPTRSYVDNIGLDGSGDNSGDATHLSNYLGGPRPSKIAWPPFPYLDPLVFSRFMDAAEPGRKRPEMTTTTTKKHKPIGRRLQRSFVRPFEKLGRRSVKKRHKALLKAAATPMERLGTSYGGWWFPSEGVGPDEWVIAAGAGEDISFDIEVAKRFGARVIIADPTPRAQRHFKQSKQAIAEGASAPINGDPMTQYAATPEVFERMIFAPVGLWSESGEQQFYAPPDAANVSHSIDNLHGSDEGFTAECLTLEALAARFEIGRLAAVKLDIEGAEFAVIEQMLASPIRPNWLMVEFHAGDDWREAHFRSRTLAMVARLGAAGFDLVRIESWNYTFERRG